MLPMYVVGGAVRDWFIYNKLNQYQTIKDMDFAVEAPNYEEMKYCVLDKYKVEIVQEDAMYGRFKAKLDTSLLKPYSIARKISEKVTSSNIMYCDFVLCRKDGTYHDGRRPSSISACSIAEDLVRRDFTINAIAINVDNDKVINPCEGINDIEVQLLRFCGDISDRIAEDYLRVIRLYRFFGILSRLNTDKCEWDIEYGNLSFINNNSAMIAAGIKASVSIERIYEELTTLFKRTSTLEALKVIHAIPEKIQNVIFSRNLHLMPSLKEL